MRVQSIALSNFKGIRRVEVEGLGGEPIIAISGRNGTGKSLILEAIAATWSNRIHAPADMVGPWGDQAQIYVEASFTTAEMEAVAAFSEFPIDIPNSLVVHTERILTRQGGGQTVNDSQVMNTLRNETFRQHHPFASIDFLPASRFVPIAQAATIDPELFGSRRTESERTQALDNFLRTRGITQFPGIKSFLATMHYLDMLTEKGDAPTSGFADVSQAFFDASGKRIEEPVVSIETGASIRVETRSGVDHDLDLLSTGEQEALALMYFIRRAATRGGVLMIDEPEQHLHPSLQAAFLSTALELTDGAQLLMVTHSPKLLSLAPVGALLRIQDSADTEGNQLEHVSDWPGRETLFTDVGLTAVDLVQHDFIVVLEGESDESFLTSLLPITMSRGIVVSAGGSHQVETMRNLLEEAEQTLPWLCIRDRDFLDSAERDTRNKRPGLFVHARRDIESLLLDAPLIYRTFERAGRDEPAMADKIRDFALTQKDEVLEHLVEKRLANDIPIVKPDTGDRWQKSQASYKARADANASRADNYQRVLDEERATLEGIWDADWPRLVDGKVMVQMIGGDSPFDNTADFVSALLRTAVEEPDIRPAELVELLDTLSVLG